MTRKNAFFEWWSWFKFNNLGLALGTNLKFYTSLSKGLKLKVRKFWGLIHTFVEVTGEKLVGGPFWLPRPQNRVKMFQCFEGCCLCFQGVMCHDLLTQGTQNPTSSKACKDNFCKCKCYGEEQSPR